jgi:hypothetical protein
MDDDDDELEGCDLDFTVAPDTDESEALRPLFPEGEPDDRWDGVTFDA